MAGPNDMQVGLLIGFMLGVGIGMTIMLALQEGKIEKRRTEERQAIEQRSKISKED